MKRLLLTLSIAGALSAQDTPQPAAPASKPAAPAAQPSVPATQSPAPTTEPAAQSPVPATESWLTGSIDLGYRWRTDVAGSFDTYRSIVDLGSGPKLLGAEFTAIDPAHRFFDRLDFRAYSWGDEPYGTLHLNVRKARLYDFRADYRDIAYFNFLPSYADPMLARGLILNQQSFDTRRHLGSYDLDLLPGGRFVPYFSYNRDSGAGTGVTTFVSGGNEYPVPNGLRDLTNLYRGGLRIALRRMHVTVEEGGTTFKDDQNLYQSGGTGGKTNPGYLQSPVLGRNLNLTSLVGAYGIRGSGTFTKGLFTANAADWLDVYGQFLYSQPDSTTSYQQAAAGTLYLPAEILFYSGEQFLLSAASKMPHTTGTAGVEVRPLRKVRILQSWLTDRFHTDGSAASMQSLFSSSTSRQIAAQVASRLVNNYNHVETDVIWDPLTRLTLRGGYRHVWGDASQYVLPPAGLASADAGRLRRDIVLGGFTFRPTSKLSITGEGEGAWDNSSYFRTSLHDYQKARAQGRYQVTSALSITGDFTLLRNQNPVPGVDYDYQARQQSLSLFWSPESGKVFDIQGTYNRSTLRSNITYLVPQDLTPQQSIDRENAHTASALINVKLPHAGPVAPKLVAGGSFIVSSGTRPTTYFQPSARLWIPTGKTLNWFAEWRYYGYGEAFYLYESFRTHLLTAGVRISR